MKNLSKWLAGIAMVAATVGFAAGVMAAPYSVTYTDTVKGGDPTLPAGINTGERATVSLILDNGNTSVANQTWAAADVQCVTFTFNNPQDKYVAINYSGKPFSSGTSGTFTTNGAGQLQAGPINWDDFNSPISNPQATNISGIVSVTEWFLDGANGVIYWNSDALGVDFTNVVNDNQVTNWSNPVPSDGVCLPAKPAPAMSNQTTIFVGVALLMAGLWSVRRLARRR